MTMREIRFAEAVREALAEEMRRDERVFTYGEDVELGYAFTVTKGLIDEFGPERVFDTPICESTIIGLGIGAAMMGFRPVPEIMFGDLIFLAMDMICNVAAKQRYMSGGQLTVPMVIRTPGGRWTGFAAQHSQTIDAFFIHVPGLKVVVPSSPYDAKGLLKTAIRDDNPVMFIEQKLIYPMIGPVPEEEYLIPFGQANVHREGKDLTIIGIGSMVKDCLEAADILVKEGVEATVIDPRTLVPLDEETILNSVARTHRVVIVEEGTKRGGVGAEIAALISERILDELDAPIQRVAALDSPVPCSLVLESHILPDTNKVVQLAKNMLAY
ncbi:MAG: alpha-ketoacid dehydrogenase subunit beta [Pseudomonadota bacterium]